MSLHPGIAEHYRRVVGDLAQALHRSDSEAAAEARDLVRRLIETVVVAPLPERGQYDLTVKGQIAALVSQDGDCTTLVGAGACTGHHSICRTEDIPALACASHTSVQDS